MSGGRVIERQYTNINSYALSLMQQLPYKLREAGIISSFIIKNSSVIEVFRQEESLTTLPVQKLMRNYRDDLARPLCVGSAKIWIYCTPFPHTG